MMYTQEFARNTSIRPIISNRKKGVMYSPPPFKGTFITNLVESYWIMGLNLRPMNRVSQHLLFVVDPGHPQTVKY